MPGTRPTLALIATLSLFAPMLLGAGGSRVDDTPTPPTLTPEQQANESYNSGLGYRDQAWRLQKKLDKPDTPEAKRAKLGKKQARAWKDAIEAYRTALGYNPNMHQAYSSLGYAYRQTGDYETAIAAYDEALKLAPDYAEAIEYRGEALLGLNRINDAQNAFRLLADQDSELTSDLLGAMRAWVAQRRADPAGVDAAAIDGLERWVEERQLTIASGSSLRKNWSW